MLTVRLSEDLERELELISDQQKVTKTEIVKKAIIEFIKANSKTPFEAGQDLFGCDDSNIKDGSKTYKQNVRRLIHEKHSH